MQQKEAKTRKFREKRKTTFFSRVFVNPSGGLPRCSKLGNAETIQPPKKIQNFYSSSFRRSFFSCVTQQRANNPLRVIHTEERIERGKDLSCVRFSFFLLLSKKRFVDGCIYVYVGKKKLSFSLLGRKKWNVDKN